FRASSRQQVRFDLNAGRGSFLAVATAENELAYFKPRSGGWGFVQTGNKHVSRRPSKPWPFRIEYPPELPISARADEIIAAIRDNQVLILAGETGSGKTTQIPKMCLVAGCG